MNETILCLIGTSGSGKDTAAEEVRRTLKCPTISMAFLIKRQIHELFGTPYSTLFGDQAAKEAPRPELGGQSSRAVMHMVGDSTLRIREDTYASLAVMRAKAMFAGEADPGKEWFVFPDQYANDRAGLQAHDATFQTYHRMRPFGPAAVVNCPSRVVVITDVRMPFEAEAILKGHPRSVFWHLERKRDDMDKELAAHRSEVLVGSTAKKFASERFGGHLGLGETLSAVREAALSL